jgi:ankyrin repeat protein
LAQRTLNEVLKSTSDSLFPVELGKAEVRIDSVDCDGETPLHVLIWRGDAEGALLLIENGANIDAVGDMGETPLHVAISKNEKRVINALLEAGARTDIVSEFGQTQAEKARQYGVSLREDT